MDALIEEGAHQVADIKAGLMPFYLLHLLVISFVI